MKSSHAIVAGIVVVSCMCAGIMFGVRTGNSAIAVASFIAGSLLVFTLKRNVDTVIEDEWTRVVGLKAASATLNVTAILFTLVGLFLITISSPENNYDQAVFAIATFLVVLSVIYLAMTGYYSRVLRGNMP